MIQIKLANIYIFVLYIYIGSWWHCGYHLTTSIVGPVLLSIPFAISLLGWAAGVLVLMLSAFLTFYAYNLLSVVMEKQAELGHRHIRFRDMARHILGRSGADQAAAGMQEGRRFTTVYSFIPGLSINY